MTLASDSGAFHLVKWTATALTCFILPFVYGPPCNAAKSYRELMEQLAAGRPGAMEAIYRRYETFLRPVLLSVLHDETEAADALHDVFLQLWDHAERYRPEKGLRGFLVTMARRRATDRVRRRDRVESRSGAVARKLRFQIPLIKPDMRLSLHPALGQGG